ncbi:LysR family transcriptional regulator [Ovoidimarina sediminis]|uniref:LysR family transcriptional regulator n=1 Tax=Ovoidimarina sediminis TaxID=3079856 RepID=UPI00291553FA|nr:LysR family transcriptional regulator [Rhodophyticola sp. MJ-SS7]MDU8945366.1 LysR substrate-binding domain-containing protein [Rhodophyticola sp. MJ-SS7]
MPATTHLRALQALEIALRRGSLTEAAREIGISPAAVGQRIRGLEDYLGTELLLRGRSGLWPTRELEAALDDLRTAFAALDRVTEKLDFQRVTEIHIVAEPDWAELWLLPRLETFRAEHPNILFCINGEGDVPVRLGAPDCRIEYGGTSGEPLYTDILMPITGPDNVRRIGDWDPVLQMQGMPLLHLEAHRRSDNHPGWVAWFETFGHRREGPDRGPHYQHARVALEAVRDNVGFLVCGLSLAARDVAEGRVVLPLPREQHLLAPEPYRLAIRPEALARPQLQRFVAWLTDEIARTVEEIAHLSGRAPQEPRIAFT